MRPYVANPQLTAPDYDFADFSKPSVAAATQPDGRMDSLPLETDFWLVYYNKQLLADKGIAFPTTLDEMLAAARAMTDKAAGTYGFVGRGLRNANVPVWTSFLLGQDQATVTADGTKAADGHAGGDLGGRILQDDHAGMRAAGRGRVQLE